MTTALKKNGWDITISGSGEVWVYHNYREFVARFKYANPKRSANHFVKFLVNNFTPAEYFAERAKGKSPLPILEAKGYVSYNANLAKAPIDEIATKLVEGSLKRMVSSEGKTIDAGIPVVIEKVVDAQHNIFIRVSSAYCKVRLPYYDTDVETLCDDTQKFIDGLPDVEKLTTSGYINVKPHAFIQDGFVLISVEHGDNAGEYYGFTGPVINPVLVEYAEKNGGHFEWRDPGTLVFVK